MADPGDYRRNGDDDEEEEEEVDESGYKTVKDAVLFAIDVSKSMLTPTPTSDTKKPDTDSPTSAALKCAYQLMQQRIISHPNDMMGILLFGTEKSKFQGEEVEESESGLAYPHCYLLTDLDVPSADDVKRLRNLVNDEEERERLLVPSKEQVTMANVLFAANQIFTTKAPNFSSRRLFLVTDNDNPHASDKTLRSAATVRAKDLYDLGVIIELFPISRPGHGFDRARFYDDIVYRPQESDPEAPAALTKEAKTSSSGDGISLLQSLLSEINSKSSPRRALFTVPFEIGPGLRIGVKGYLILKRQDHGRSCYVWLGGEKPQIAVGSSSKIAEDTARTVEKVEIRKAYRFGGDKVLFTPDETKELRTFGDPVIRIIGFKPIKLLPIWANCRTPMFIYPSETDFIGSTRVFSALYQTLIKQLKFALCWVVPRRNASPILAAVIPSMDVSDVPNEEDDPTFGMFSQGLWIIQLPFADDIRSNPDTTLVRAPDVLIDDMRDVIAQLMLPPKGTYDPRRHPNPALQWHYKVLQAIALDEDMPEQDKDRTLPAYKQIHKRVKEIMPGWGQNLEDEYQKFVAERGSTFKTASKRKADGDGAPSKRVKTSQGSAPAVTSDAPDDAGMKKHFEKGSLAKLKVADLKEWLQGKGVKVTGAKKADLVEMVEEQFEKK